MILPFVESAKSNKYMFLFPLLFIAQFLGRMDPLRWTSHLAVCLETLPRNPETENGAVFVLLTRIPLVVGKIVQCSSLSDVDNVPRAAPNVSH
jgi:hypothetical protein